MRKFWQAFWFGFCTALPLTVCMVLYWLGHAWSRVVVARWPDSWERSGMAMAGVYSWLMGKSVAINDRFGLEVWK